MGIRSSKDSEAVLQDRISELSDAILCHILSFIGTRDAVKTSILSRRWKNVWVFVPSISLYDTDNECDCGSCAFCLCLLLKHSPGCEPENVKPGFKDVVDHVLFARGSSNIDRFKLCCRGICDFSRIDEWIRTAIMCNAVELDLNFEQSHQQPLRFELPKSVFLSRTLVVLRLFLRPNFIAIPPTSESDSFPSLKSLEVKFYWPDVDSIQKLVSCCPVIEDLRMGGFLAPAHVYHFKVSTRNLKKLDTCFLGLSDPVPVYVDVDAPNLEKFGISGGHLAVYSLHNAKALHEARITLDIILEPGPGFSDRMHELFAGISNVESLSVSAPTSGDHLLPTFHNLKQLKLTRGLECSWQSLTNFLKVSPNLEYLDIRSAYQGDGGLAWEWIPPESVPIALLSCLKDVCIQLAGWPGEVEIMKYLLKHGNVLNNMRIHDSDSCCSWTEKAKTKERRVIKGLSICWASQTCQVFFNGRKVLPSFPFMALAFCDFDM